MSAQVLAISLVIGGVRWPVLDRYAGMAMWAVVVFALVSAADYFRKFWRKVDDQVKRRRRRELLILQREERLRKREARLASMARAGAGQAAAAERTLQ
jgi:hypothetical protein